MTERLTHSSVVIYGSNNTSRSDDPIVDSVLEDVLKSEGWPDYTDHPHDRGGPTKGGITLQTLREWRGDDDLTEEDLRRLTRDEALLIYRSEYVERPGFLQIHDSRLFHLMVDCSVLHGPGRSVRWLQRAVRVTEDGVFGPITLDAVLSNSPHRVSIVVSCIRMTFLGRFIKSDPSQSSFAHGWYRRVASFLLAEVGSSLKMIGE